jgi:hypothetical protein
MAEQNKKAVALRNGLLICWRLILLFAILFTRTLARQSLFHSALLAWFQVVGVTLHFLDNVFRLNLALESTQGVL